MLSDDQIVDLYWTSTGDDWAIPDYVMVKFARAVLATQPSTDPSVSVETAWTHRCGKTCTHLSGCGLHNLPAASDQPELPVVCTCEGRRCLCGKTADECRETDATGICCDLCTHQEVRE